MLIKFDKIPLMGAGERNKYKVQGISFLNEEFLEDAKRRAAELGFSLSDYVCRLVREDLKHGGDFIIRPAQISSARGDLDQPKPEEGTGALEKILKRSSRSKQ